ncbi:MAG: SDR family NAD(P)-dependent oxidoreductase [Phycisphaerales bacterium]|nr:SDR family NAD(P)-dependent oxidoreductase [Phycisphaerales bacterium]
MATAQRKWVVVSGASTGIGRSAAMLLAEAGFSVLAGCRRDADAESIRDEAAKRGVGPLVEPIRLEVTSDSDIAACRDRVQDLIRNGGELAGLVNNAGMFLFGPAETMPLSEWRRQFDTNFFGAIALTQALLPALLARKGTIVNISSIGGKVAQPLMGAYTASKFAMEAWSDALRMELSATGVRVVVIEPGAIRTPILGKALSQEDQAIAAIPMPARTRYEPMLRNLAVAGKKMADAAIHPDKVGRQIVAAVGRKRSFRRKLVGTDAHVFATMKWMLPTRWMDAFLIKAFGLHR